MDKKTETKQNCTVNVVLLGDSVLVTTKEKQYWYYNSLLVFPFPP